MIIFHRSCHYRKLKIKSNPSHSIFTFTDNCKLKRVTYKFPFSFFLSRRDDFDSVSRRMFTSSPRTH